MTAAAAGWPRRCGRPRTSDLTAVLPFARAVAEIDLSLPLVRVRAGGAVGGGMEFN